MTTCLACGHSCEPDALQCTACRTGEGETEPKRKRRRKQAEPADLFADWCEQAGLPRPVAEYRFAPPRRWRFDYAWPERMLALEVEGGVWTGGRHVRGEGYTKDMEKYTRASLEGWTLIRRTPSDLCTAETLELLREALERAA